MGRRYHHIYSKICTKEEASVNCFFQFVLSCYSWISDPAENSPVETLPKTHNSECLNKTKHLLFKNYFWLIIFIFSPHLVLQNTLNISLSYAMALFGLQRNELCVAQLKTLTAQWPWVPLTKCLPCALLMN